MLIPSLSINTKIHCVFDKHSSLLKYGINYFHKNFIAMTHKTAQVDYKSCRQIFDYGVTNLQSKTH